MSALLSDIRNLKLGLMFDEATTIGHTVAPVPAVKKDLFDNVKKLMEELKREDSYPPSRHTAEINSPSCKI